MIDTQSLRTKILDLAMRGRLTEQLPEDGTAEELYQQIQEEKQALIKAGKIKKEKPLPEITEGEKPFAIPESWKWVRLGKVITLVSGTDYKPEEYNDQNRGIPYITGASNLLPKGVLINRWTENPRCIANCGDVLLVCKGSGYGKVAICDIEVAHIARQIMAIKKTDSLVMKYILYYLMANYDSLKSKGQGLIPGVDRQNVLNMQFPLPPLAEQQRVVERVQQTFSVLDTIDELQTKYADNLTVLKSKLIDAAIQGKLTEQLPEDGTAEELYQQIQEEKQALIRAGKIKKEKPLPEITEGEKPFEIPASWKWVSVGDVCINIQYGSSKKSSETGKIPVIRMGNIQDGKIVYDKLVYTSDDNEIAKYPLEKGDLLFNRTNSMELVGKTGLYNGEQPAIYAGYLVRVTPLLLFPEYLNYCMQSKYYWDYCRMVRIDSNGQSNINAEKLKRFLFPFPPLAEQQRIVARLDKALAMIES